MRNISKITVTSMLSSLIVVIGAVAHTTSNKYIRILIPILVII
ncbi:hypothetical protein [Clostridium sp.]|nr:hypothetical protein [Clostridium sp.]MDR3593192.1 hypothetical protein [Clostridium sp.]